jgi:peptidoglycan/xylan/chitin deacetylase (PgdA/CDA1 family)
MTKRQVLVRYVLLALFAALVTVALDALFVRSHLGWLAWLLDVSFASALVVVSVGCFGHNAPFFGRVVDGQGVHERVVALTFDDGPSPDTTPRVLDALRAAGMRATFFVLGKHAEQHPELVERMVREGHEVASHGYSHGLLVFASPRQITWELNRAQHLLQGAGGPPVRHFRCPHGFRNPFVVPVARRLGYRVVGWTKGVFDTALPGADVIAHRSAKALVPGAILLLHDADGNGDGDRSQTADALPRILDAVRERELEAVTIAELARLAPERRTSWKRLALVVAVVAVLVTVGFERLDRNALHNAWNTVRSLSVPLLVAALVANLVSVLFKAVVWRACLETMPGRPRFALRQVVPAIFVGFLLNAALVARLGEVGRMVVLRRRMQKDEGLTLSIPAIAGTVVMEQVVLGVTLVGILLLMTFTISNVPFVLRRGVLVLVGVVAALVAAVLAVEGFSRYRRRRRRGQPPRVADESSLRSWRAFVHSAEALLHGVSGGLRLFRIPVKAGESIAAGILSWLAQLAGIWLTLRAFGISDHALGKSAAVFLASNLIGLIQVTPGNLGTFQVAVASALSQTYGVDWYTGFTFGIVLQAIEIALGAGLGFVFLSREGLSFGEVRRGISAAERETAEPEPPPLAPDRLERRRLVV